MSTTLLLGGMGVFMLMGDPFTAMTWSACLAIVAGFCDGIIFGYALEERRVESEST